jgi:hypothetical protein
MGWSSPRTRTNCSHVNYTPPALFWRHHRVAELPSNIVINNFYARLTLHDKDLLDASCSGSFSRMKEEAKWVLLDRIQENTEGWENDKGRKSGINYDYECIKAFMGTDDFHDVSAVYGLDSQILANCFKAFATYLDVP